MVFSSPEYPAFLLAVFFMYLLMRQQGMGGLVARLALLLLLGDLVYLLVVKDVRQLWDPLGYAVYSAYAGVLGAKVTPPRPWLHLVAGGLCFGLTVCLGLRGGAWLDRARIHRLQAWMLTMGVVFLGTLVAVTAHLGTLHRLTALMADGGHLLFLLLFGLGVGAALRPGGRRFGRLLMLLLVSSLFYHAWAVGMPGAYKYLLLLIVGTICLDYYLALWIDRSRSVAMRRFLLVFSLVSNLGVLCLFKYLGFFLETVRGLASLLGISAAETQIPVLSLILPAGISFHTFQSLSYTIDVYQKRLRPTSSMLDFATFVLFFPQLVAGPIVRAHEFLPQIQKLDGDQQSEAEGRTAYLVDAQAAQGLFRILIGLLKKVALADLLATQLVDRVFADPRLFSGLEVLAAVYGYAFQIYLDFSGYSDIAIGSALLLGFQFPENFQTPYRSADLQEFWRRWHITLSTWLRDYLYIPLGGSRGGSWLTYRNLIITMLLGGLWHGASWTFIVWGALHGGGLAATRLWQRMAGRPGGRAVWMLLLALLWGGGGVFLLRAGGDRLEEASASLGIDAAWVYLVVGWLALTPVWAALSAALANDPDRSDVAGERTEPPAGSSGPGWLRGEPGELPAAALRLAGLALSIGAVTVLAGPARPDERNLAWLALGVGYLITALGDLADHGGGVRWFFWLALRSLRRTLAILLTFHYVCFAWVFFRATSFEKAREVLAQIGTLGTDVLNVTGSFRLALLLAVLAHFYPPSTFIWLRRSFVALPPSVRAAVLAGAVVLLSRLAQPQVVPFIYFQF